MILDKWKKQWIFIHLSGTVTVEKSINSHY